MRDWQHDPLEDDYSEESGPDSVARDHNAIDGIASLRRWRRGQMARREFEYKIDEAHRMGVL